MRSFGWRATASMVTSQAEWPKRVIGYRLDTSTTLRNQQTWRRLAVNQCPIIIPRRPLRPIRRNQHVRNPYELQKVCPGQLGAFARDMHGRRYRTCSRRRPDNQAELSAARCGGPSGGNRGVRKTVGRDERSGDEVDQAGRSQRLKGEKLANHLSAASDQIGVDDLCRCPFPHHARPRRRGDRVEYALLRCVSPIMALFGHDDMPRQSPLCDCRLNRSTQHRR
jgi:hypothetical protein